MNKLNLNHDENSFIDAFMVEDFIVDSEARVADLKLKGIEHPNIMGAWYTAFKIKDKNVFESFLNGESGMGFSVEAYLNRFSNQINNKFNKMKKILLIISSLLPISLLISSAITLPPDY